MIEKKIRIKNLEELINQPRLVKYDTYEFDELSYTCLLVDIKMLLEENKKYKEVINELRNYLKTRIEVCDNRLSTPFCNFEKTTKERLILSQCLEKLEELEAEDK